MAWTWRFHAHFEVWLLAAVFLGAYFHALRRLGPSLAPAGQPPATRRQIRNFVLAVFSLLISSTWPIHDLAEGYLYSVHMVQHIILSMALPPLLLTGTPAWLFHFLVPPRALRVVRALSRPLVALLIFNAVIVFTHWPKIVDAAVTNELEHLSLHVLLVLAALLMWMPVLGPVPEIPRLSYPGRMFYLFLQSLVPTVPASFLTFGARPLYHSYEAFPRLGGISALADQRAAGLIMKIGGGLILWGFIAAIFFRWYRVENESGGDALGRHDLDKTLNRMELKK